MKDVHAEILNLPNPVSTKGTTQYRCGWYHAHQIVRESAAALVLPLQERLAELEYKEKEYGDARILLRDFADKIRKGEATPTEQKLHGRCKELEEVIQALTMLCQVWRTQNGDYPESKQDCASDLSDAIAKVVGQKD